MDTGGDGCRGGQGGCTFYYAWNAPRYLLRVPANNEANRCEGNEFLPILRWVNP
nr:hypothetical protein [Priestia megaterium]